ncbi:MAG: VOC family protein [Kitasatospora sp.]|jgi:catechol 2,3-dioxygenase-like lactoylglutathione lyase family enzyme|nr:VOC family protein [Kitasatospora sp.]
MTVYFVTVHLVRKSEPMAREPGLVPELSVTDLATSQRFWCDLLGFVVKYARLDEGFAYLVLGEAHLMLDQAGLGRTWITAALKAPLGRGVNFQLAVPDLEPVLGRLNAAGWPLFGGVEERWYRTGAKETGVSQFLVQDPDGYLVRPQQTLGSRPAQD